MKNLYLQRFAKHGRKTSAVLKHTLRLKSSQTYRECLTKRFSLISNPNSASARNKGFRTSFLTSDMAIAICLENPACIISATFLPMEYRRICLLLTSERSYHGCLLSLICSRSLFVRYKSQSKCVTSIPPRYTCTPGQRAFPIFIILALQYMW